MTLPALNQKQMLSILTANGYNTTSSEYWDLEGVERIVMSNGVNSFVFKLKKFGNDIQFYTKKFGNMK